MRSRWQQGKQSQATLWELELGRMKDHHTLNGLGGGYDPRMGKDSAKKSSSGGESKVLVPETDTGGEVEKTKGRERTLSKELGKMAP